MFAEAYLTQLEMEPVSCVRILDKAVSISLCSNAFGKGMNLSLLPPAMGK